MLNYRRWMILDNIVRDFNNYRIVGKLRCVRLTLFWNKLEYVECPCISVPEYGQWNVPLISNSGHAYTGKIPDK